MLQMNEKQWGIAHNLAADMVKQGTDPNEFGKVVAFMRQYRGEANAKDLLMLLLQRLVDSPNAPIRSDQTPEYYQKIQNACKEHLSDVSDTSELMIVLGWGMRLMRYYRAEQGRAFGEQRPQKPKQRPKPASVQTPQPPKEPEKPKLKVGDRVNATVLKKGAIDVTVKLQTDEKEEIVFGYPYYPGKVGEQVRLKVLNVNQNGEITKVAP